MTTSPDSTPPEGAPPAIGLADIEAAARRLAGHAQPTPLLEWPSLNERLGGRVLLKAENLQRTGSFKFRGAFNRISAIPESARAAGVVAYSSGNHAQGVAAAARLLEVPATIVMPRDAPAIKIGNTRALGAKVVLYDRAREDRKAIAEGIAAERGATVIAPYDDPLIIAGQGTCGLESCRQAEAMGARPELLIVPCGGGGLIAGCALAFGALMPRVEVFAAEPAGFDDTARSLVAGARVANRPEARSFCDALLVETPGGLTFAINRRHLAGGLTVDDTEVAAAMAYAFAALKLVVEPGGAVALAALLSKRLELAGRTAVVVLSGGNVDAETYAEAIKS